MSKYEALSQPVAYDYQIAGACIADHPNPCGKWVGWQVELSRECPPDWMVEEGKVKDLKPRYSQEYVTALIQRAEAAERREENLNASVDVLAQRVKDLEGAALVPGVLHCAKCQFQLTKTNLYMATGTTGPGDNKTEPCPNGCGPLWPVTWKQWAIDELKSAGQRLRRPARLPDPIGWKPPSGRNVLLESEVIQKLLEQGFNVEKGL
ncbi:hypothetical protein [Serratia fonticola]|uniref:hypothetical protein n=1 Tax=Serratia fonticola TaxID=47917 RepID=UPI000463EDE3|nr:hypothetical protein [Serratia fonticola]